MKRSEGTFKVRDGIKLFYQKWHADRPKGTLIITHGQAEHSECYDRLAKSIEPMEWEVIAWDLRGHGRSEGKRGFAENFNCYCDDYLEFLDQVSTHESIVGRPKVLLGHSMGGLIQLKTLINSPEVTADAQVLSSPLLGLKTKVSPLKENLGSFVVKFLPELTLWNQIDFRQLTRDKQILEEYEKDPLRHDRISPQVYLGILHSTKYVQNSVKRISLPTLMQLAGQDEIVSNEDSVKFFEKLEVSRKSKFVYESSKHETYNDLNRSQVFEDLMDFLKGFEK